MNHNKLTLIVVYLLLGALWFHPAFAQDDLGELDTMDYSDLDDSSSEEVQVPVHEVDPTDPPIGQIRSEACVQIKPPRSPCLCQCLTVGSRAKNSRTWPGIRRKDGACVCACATPRRRHARVDPFTPYWIGKYAEEAKHK